MIHLSCGAQRGATKVPTRRPCSTRASLTRELAIGVPLLDRHLDILQASAFTHAASAAMLDREAIATRKWMTHRLQRLTACHVDDARLGNANRDLCVHDLELCIEQLGLCLSQLDGRGLPN